MNFMGKIGMTHSYIQKGTFSIAILLPLTVLIAGLTVSTGIKNPDLLLAFVPALIIMVCCLLTFYKLTITVSDDEISFSMGAGLIKRKYPVAGIASCKAVKNSPLTGIGIRLLPNGWLYNVSGLGAIELSFKNRKSVVRIGTDEPERISAEINKILNPKGSFPSVQENSHKNAYWLVLLILLSVLFPALILIRGSREPEIEISGNSLHIKGLYSMVVPINQVSYVDTVPGLPSIKRRTNGFASSGILKGNFTDINGEKLKLFIRKDKPPYIFIKMKDQMVYLNFSERSRTVEIYKILQIKMTENRTREMK